MNSKKIIVSICVMGIAGLIVWFGFYYNVEFYNREFAQSIPHEIDGMKSMEIHMDQKTIDILETSDVMFRKYEKENMIPVYFCVIYSQNNRKVAHPPELCLSGGGNVVEFKEGINFDTPVKQNFDAKKLIVVHSNSKWMYLYWYKSGRFYSSNYLLQQFLAAVTQLVHRKSSCALIRLSTPIPQEEEPPFKESEERLMKFSKTILPILSEKLP